MHVSGRQSDPGWTLVHARERPLHEFRLEYVEQPKPCKEPVGLSSQVHRIREELAELRTKVESFGQRGAEPGNGPKEDSTGILRERIMNLSPSEFERLVGEFLKAKGFSNVIVTQRSHDGGIDGHCELPFINVRVAFQAKRYTEDNTVGINPVQRLQGALAGGFDRGVFITTSKYSHAASSWVDEEKVNITLIDGNALLKQMMDLGLGITAVGVVRYEVDESFFTSL